VERRCNQTSSFTSTRHATAWLDYSECFQVYLDGFARAFPHSQNVMILDNGRFHKAKRLTIPANVRLVFFAPVQPGAQSG
jgi:hypothetical protein